MEPSEELPETMKHITPVITEYSPDKNVEVNLLFPKNTDSVLLEKGGLSNTKFI